MPPDGSFGGFGRHPCGAPESVLKRRTCRRNHPNLYQNVDTFVISASRLLHSSIHSSLLHADCSILRYIRQERSLCTSDECIEESSVPSALAPNYPGLTPKVQFPLTKLAFWLRFGTVAILGFGGRLSRIGPISAILRYIRHFCKPTAPFLDTFVTSVRKVTGAVLGSFGALRILGECISNNLSFCVHAICR